MVHASRPRGGAGASRSLAAPPRAIRARHRASAAARPLRYRVPAAAPVSLPGTAGLQRRTTAVSGRGLAAALGGTVRRDARRPAVGPQLGGESRVRHRAAAFSALVVRGRRSSARDRGPRRRARRDRGLGDRRRRRRRLRLRRGGPRGQHR